MAKLWFAIFPRQLFWDLGRQKRKFRGSKFPKREFRNQGELLRLGGGWHAANIFWVNSASTFGALPATKNKQAFPRFPFPLFRLQEPQRVFVIIRTSPVLRIGFLAVGGQVQFQFVGLPIFQKGKVRELDGRSLA
jgi:hypothetical protein